MKLMENFISVEYIRKDKILKTISVHYKNPGKKTAKLKRSIQTLVFYNEAFSPACSYFSQLLKTNKNITYHSNCFSNKYLYMYVPKSEL